MIKEKIKNIIHKFSFVKIKQEIKNELTAKNQSNNTISLSIALGLFLAFSPFWGFQTILAVSLALFFRLNKVLVLIAVNISSIPPLIPLIIYMNFQCGNFLFTGNFSNEIPVITEISSLGKNLLVFVAGGISTGILVGILSYYTIIIILKIKK